MRQFTCILSATVRGMFAGLAATLAVPAAQFQIGAHNFTLPDGFEIELVAGTNLAPRPIEADFDEQGRLYVTDSSGSNDKPDKQLIEKPHRIVRLEDTDGDGRFDKQLVFADKMSFLEGCMWKDGSLYVAAPPSIWKLTDTNGDGVADVRVEWFQGKTLTGCANDLHGPYAGPDGWIYWCKGAFAKQTYTLPNGKEFTTRASHIFRARPDGSGVEPIMTGGMDNPVGLAWSAEGELFLSGTFFQHPAGGKRDGIIHVLYGGVYGKDHDVLNGHPRTGDLLPIMTHLGAAAPCGMVRYESSALGEAFQNNLFVCSFNMHKIVRCVLKPKGATYETTDSDFLVSDNTDFHPTDVLEDADGSLIVVDTGGWYKLCCPTSQLYKPDVLGGIYRIRRKNAPQLGDARGKTISWSKQNLQGLQFLLDDPRPAVVNAAIERLAGQGASAVGVLRKAAGFGQPPFASPPAQPPTRRKRLNVVWTLARIDSPDARAAIRYALNDRDESVRQASLHCISLWHDETDSIHLGEFLRPDQREQTRRLAAEAIGRVKATNLVSLLLHQGFGDSETIDRSLEHALIYALLEIGDAESVMRYGFGNGSGPPLMTRASLITLDQLPGTNVTAAMIMPMLRSTNTLLRETAWSLAKHHTEWGNALIAYFKDRLGAAKLSKQEENELVSQLAAFAPDSGVQQLLATRLIDAGLTATVPSPEVNRVDLALRAMGSAQPKQTPDAWVHGFQVLLERSASSSGRLGEALQVLRRLSLNNQQRAQLRPILERIVNSDQYEAADSLEAAAVLSNVALNESLFEFARKQLRSDDLSARRLAAGVLSKARLTQPQMLTLAQDVKSVGPLELPKILTAFNRTPNESIGFALVDSLTASKSVSSLRPETLKPVLTNFPASVRQKAEALLASLNTDAAQEKKHIDEMLATVKGGDIRRGQAIFNSPKAACSSCHAIGYLGGNVGPDLTRIGQIRNERDLLEAIVYPSASFVRSYEPVVVSTKSGDDFNGILKKDAPDEVVLVTGPNAEQRIARNNITDMRPGSVSVMPSGLADQLSKQEVADLLAFLKATRW